MYFFLQKCYVCNQKGASIGCVIKSCKKTFHRECGLKQNCQFIFMDNYESFCHLHVQLSDSFSPTTDKKCPICKDEVNNFHPVTTIQCKQCKIIFHSHCLRTQANLSGNHFKCCLCNSYDQFRDHCKKSGVFIPER